MQLLNCAIISYCLFVKDKKVREDGRVRLLRVPAGDDIGHRVAFHHGVACEFLALCIPANSRYHSGVL